MMIPNRPIVVFSESNTGHWDSKQCKLTPHKVDASEKALLSSSTEKLVTEMNIDEGKRAFGYLENLEKKYRGAGLQRVHLFAFITATIHSFL